MRTRNTQFTNNSRAAAGSALGDPGKVSQSRTLPRQNAREPQSQRPQQQGTDSRKRVELALNMPDARSAAIAGSFNDWDWQKTPMRREEGPNWKASLSLPPGRYEYRFLVDGRWVSDPNAKESVANPFGSTNSVLVV